MCKIDNKKEVVHTERFDYEMTQVMVDLRDELSKRIIIPDIDETEKALAMELDWEKKDIDKIPKFSGVEISPINPYMIEKTQFNIKLENYSSDLKRVDSFDSKVVYDEPIIDSTLNINDVKLMKDIDIKKTDKVSIHDDMCFKNFHYTLNIQLNKELNNLMWKEEHESFLRVNPTLDFGSLVINANGLKEVITTYKDSYISFSATNTNNNFVNSINNWHINKGISGHNAFEVNIKQTEEMRDSIYQLNSLCIDYNPSYISADKIKHSVVPVIENVKFTDIIENRSLMPIKEFRVEADKNVSLSNALEDIENLTSSVINSKKYSIISSNDYSQTKFETQPNWTANEQNLKKLPDSDLVYRNEHIKGAQKQKYGSIRKVENTYEEISSMLIREEKYYKLGQVPVIINQDNLIDSKEYQQVIMNFSAISLNVESLWEEIGGPDSLIKDRDLM